MKIVIIFFVLSIATFTCFADANSDFEQGMQEANKYYQYQQQEQQKQQMQQYQKDAGNFVPGTLDKQVSPNTYVAPTYQNGQIGVQGTQTFK